MSHDKLIQIIAGAVMVVLLAGSGVVGTTITESSSRHRLVMADTAADNDSPEVAVGIAMARSAACSSTCSGSANRLREEGKYYEAIETAETITKLQPRFRASGSSTRGTSRTTSQSPRRPRTSSGGSFGVRLLRDEGIPRTRTTCSCTGGGTDLSPQNPGVTDDANQYYKRNRRGMDRGPRPPPPRARDAHTRAGDRGLRQLARRGRHRARHHRGAIRKNPRRRVIAALEDLFGTEARSTRSADTPSTKSSTART